MGVSRESMTNKSENKKTGALGEDIATRFLENKGFTIAARNYKKKYGEVDIIAKKGDCMHFVEVKSVLHVKAGFGGFSRETGGYRPEELVHPLKLKKIVRVAETYMADQSESLDCQIDVIAVFIDMERKIGRCRFTENVN